MEATWTRVDYRPYAGQIRADQTLALVKDLLIAHDKDLYPKL